MSEIYNKTFKILNKITFTIKNSFLMVLLYNIVLAIENKWVNSFLKKIYPSKNFLSILKKSEIIKNYIFHPIIILVVFAIFLMLSTQPLNLNLESTLIIAFIFFIIGAIVIPMNLKCNKIIKFPYEDLYSLGLLLIIIGIIFFFICIATVGGVPLLKPSLRYSLKPIFTMPVLLIIPGMCILASVYTEKMKINLITRSQARFRFLILLIITSLFILSLGYRTHLLSIILILIILGYYGDIIAPWEVVIGALLAIGLIIGIGYYRSLSEYAITKATSPFYSLQSRADFTLNVLNKLNTIGGNYGVTHGHLIASSIPGSEKSPRMIVGKLIAWRTEVSVTPTLIGQMVADFGKIGVAIEMTLLGFNLGIGFKIVKITKNYFYIGLYALIITYAILGVETGILDIQVIIYYLIALFIFIIIIFKSNINKN